MTPLLTGQVDVVTGWLTNTTALKVLGAGPRRPAPVGHRRASSTRCPTTPPTKTLQTQARRCWRLRPRASAQGLGICRQEPRQGRGRHAGQGVLRTSTAPTKRGAADVMLTFAFYATHQGRRLGRDGPGDLAGPDRALRELGQFSAGAPKLEDVMTTRHPRSRPRAPAPRSAERRGRRVGRPVRADHRALRHRARAPSRRWRTSTSRPARRASSPCSGLRAAASRRCCAWSPT